MGFCGDCHAIITDTILLFYKFCKPTSILGLAQISNCQCLQDGFAWLYAESAPRVVSGANDAMVKITLPNNDHIHATRYQHYLPTEKELIEELERERADVERRHYLNTSD